MDKSKLLAPRLKTGTVDIPDVGEVTVRALSRQEMVEAEKWQKDGTLAWERKTLALAMVEPKLTEAEIEQWQASSPATELNAVAAKINELSGIGKDASKEAYKSDGDGPEPGV